MIADILNSGFEGIPISYSPRTDDVIALTLLACFFLSSIALARGKKFLTQQVKDFVLHRERTSSRCALSPRTGSADLCIDRYRVLQLFS